MKLYVVHKCPPFSETLLPVYDVFCFFFQARNNIRYTWKKHIFRDRNPEIKLDAFIEYMTEDYLADPVKFREDNRDFQDISYNLVDKDGDNRISLDEFSILYAAYGNNNKQMIKEMYEMFQTEFQIEGDDIPVSLLKDAWVDFVARDNPQGPNKQFRFYQSKMESQ